MSAVWVLMQPLPVEFFFLTLTSKLFGARICICFVILKPFWGCMVLYGCCMGAHTASAGWIYVFTLTSKLCGACMCVFFVTLKPFWGCMESVWVLYGWMSGWTYINKCLLDCLTGAYWLQGKKGRNFWDWGAFFSKSDHRICNWIRSCLG